MSGVDPFSFSSRPAGDVPLVVVIDSDSGIRNAAIALFSAHDWMVKTYPSGEGFFADECGADVPSCVIADLRLPGMNGLEVMRRLWAQNAGIPVIFITASPDEKLAKELEKVAVEVLLKPVEGSCLMGKILAKISGGL